MQGKQGSLFWELFQIEDLITSDGMLCALYGDLAGRGPCGNQDVFGLHRAVSRSGWQDLVQKNRQHLIMSARSLQPLQHFSRACIPVHWCVHRMV